MATNNNNNNKFASVEQAEIKQSADNPAPQVHYKCRFDSNDKSGRCSERTFTRTTDVFRDDVPVDKISWKVNYPEYKPAKFTAKKIYDRSVGDYKDPSERDHDYSKIKFNNDTKQSHHGNYILQLNPELGVIVPLNPVGRTGIIGRGHLGKWGPNHAADPVVTRWKRDESGGIVKDPQSGRPILQFVAIQRKDTKEWAIPGGMVERGEFPQTTLAREFAEEALSKEFEYITKVVNYKIYSIVTESNEFEQAYNKFFLSGEEIYRGYVDDPRNTDNAWMETIVCNFHDDKNQFVGNLKLEGGSDAEKAKWMDLNSSLKLFASHSEFLERVAKARNCHW